MNFLSISLFKILYESDFYLASLSDIKQSAYMPVIQILKNAFCDSFTVLSQQYEKFIRILSGELISYMNELPYIWIIIAVPFYMSY